MPRGCTKYDLGIKRGGFAKREKPSPVCQACRTPLFRGVTCPVCEDDLMVLFLKCVDYGEATITLNEAISLGMGSFWQEWMGRRRSA